MNECVSTDIKDVGLGVIFDVHDAKSFMIEALKFYFVPPWLFSLGISQPKVYFFRRCMPIDVINITEKESAYTN